MRWRWKRLLIVPLLGSAHACDCGSCFELHPVSCGPPSPDVCGVGGQCSSEGGTCPDGLQLDPTTSCDEGGGFCCIEPPPTCADMGGVCGPIFESCQLGTINADCGGNGVCCVPPIGDDGSFDAGMLMLDAPSTDAEGAPDTTVMGSCNEAPCASGCTCVPFAPGIAVSPDAAALPSDATMPAPDSATLPPDGATLQPDAGGGMCVCALVDASADAQSSSNADAGDAGASASTDAETSDAAEAGHAMTPADGSPEADAAGPCGVISCAVACTCTSSAASACVCP